MVQGLPEKGGGEEIAYMLTADFLEIGSLRDSLESLSQFIGNGVGQTFRAHQRVFLRLESRPKERIK